MASLKPYATFEIKAEKKGIDMVNAFEFVLPLSEELLSNGTWYIKVRCVHIETIDFYGDKIQGGDLSKVKRKLQQHRLFKLECNLVKNDFLWMSKVRRFVKTQDYPENQPMDYIELGELGNNTLTYVYPTHDPHLINNLEKELKITLTCLDEDYKIDRINSDSSVLVSLYK